MASEAPISKVPHPLGDREITDKAQSMFKRLSSQGYESRQIVSVAARIVGLVTEKLSNETKTDENL